jgi:hypothetical protein
MQEHRSVITVCDESALANDRPGGDGDASGQMTGSYLQDVAEMNVLSARTDRIASSASCAGDR